MAASLACWSMLARHPGFVLDSPPLLSNSTISDHTFIGISLLTSLLGMDADCKNSMVTMLVSFGKGCVTGGAGWSGIRVQDASAAAMDMHSAGVVSFPDSLLEDLGGEPTHSQDLR